MSDQPPKKKRSEEREDLVLTPGGWRSKSKVHKVEPGQHVEVQDGRLKVVDSATGETVADLGEVGEEGDGTVRGGGAMKKAERPEPTE
jgi:hypothetical protein